MAGMPFTEYDLGQLKRRSTVVVTLSGSGANVRLMDRTNLSSYKNGRQHRFFGGLVTRSPARIGVPSDGHWYLTVDLMGLRGGTRSSVRVEAPPLQPLRPLQPLTPMAQVPLTEIAHESPVMPNDWDPGNADADAADSEQTWDVFISHATEDKDSIARPLAAALQDLGITTWLDELELKIGDSLRRKIDYGLSHSRFGVVVLSRAFLAKEWPQYELDGLVTRQNSGEQNLLPIWHEITKAEVVAASPSLADKIARSTAQFTPEEIAGEIASVVRPSDA
jgi:hypothetical protein